MYSHATGNSQILAKESVRLPIICLVLQKLSLPGDKDCTLHTQIEVCTDARLTDKQDIICQKVAQFDPCFPGVYFAHYDGL